MKVIGITGASGSGKTTICQILNKHEDIKIIDTDKMAKQLTNTNSEYFAEIKQKFKNDKIINLDGSLNRAKLAEIIYTSKNSLEMLNRITFKHLIPAIIEEINCVSKEINIVIIDAPLLFEAGLDKYCDCTIAVETSENLKIKRICMRDNISEKVAKERLRIQNTNDFYRKKSDYVIINDENTTMEELEEKINEIIKECEKNENNRF